VNAAAAMSLDDIGTAAHDAMLDRPAFALRADKLLAAATRDERTVLLVETDPALRESALQYLAEPEATRERERRLQWLRADARRISALCHYYAASAAGIADFIHEWGVTVDPRLIAKGKPALMPFTLWPKQRELVLWLLDRWLRGEPGTVVKSRDVGASWLAMAVLASLCIFRRNFAAGVASATEPKLDRIGDPDTLFYKLREFVGHLPPEFRAGYTEDANSAYLRLRFPDTGSSITGEAGDKAGRGARKGLYIVDESAHFEHPRLIDAALAATTECRIDISSVNGIGNSFYDRAHNADIPRFDITWRDDPRKDTAWYAKQVATLDPIVVAQEIDCNFAAAREGVVIPSAWVQATIGLHARLGVVAAGARYAALDLGDQGDRSALAVRHGNEVLHVGSWSGAGSDLLFSVGKAFALCDEWAVTDMLYDADGLGSAARGDARVLNEARRERDQHLIVVEEYRGSGTPVGAGSIVPRTNRRWSDLVANRKAQAWYSLRLRFQESWKASRGEPYDAANIISISPDIPELNKLLAELSQPTMRENSAGRLLVDKVGDGEHSPNLADSLCMVMAPRPSVFKITEAALARLSRLPTHGEVYGYTP